MEASFAVISAAEPDALPNQSQNAHLANADVYLVGDTALVDSLDPAIRSWVDQYRLRTGRAAPDRLALAYYEGVQILAQALARSSAGQPAAVRDALAATKNYPGLLYPYTFDANGDGVHVVPISQWQGDQLVLVDRVWMD